MMLTRVLVIAVLAMGIPCAATAQSDDRTAIVVEALKYMRAELGANMVLDGRMRAHFVMQGKATEILDTVGVKLQARFVDSKAERRCSPKGLSYYPGSEKFVSFGEPQISGDSATVSVNWTYTPEKNPRSLFAAFYKTIVSLHRTAAGWSVTGEANRQPLHLLIKFCDSSAGN
jgi:hypothetical protein